MVTRQIRSMADMMYAVREKPRVLTLFSGGLDSSYILSHLQRVNCETTALVVNLGGDLDLDQLSDTARAFGARLEVVDARDQFAREAVVPAIRAQAKYLGVYPLSSSLSRPIIASAAVRAAEQFDCDTVIHTANQSQNSLRRLNGAISQLGYEGFYGSPYEFDAIPRARKAEELRGLGIDTFAACPVSGDANLWCREFESGSLDNPEDYSVPDTAYHWTARLANGTPRVAERAELVLEFELGVPVSVNGLQLPLRELIDYLNFTVGAHGVGRFEGLEYLDGDEKVLEIREAPAALALMAAFRHLEMATLPAELLREKSGMEQLWVREAIEGRWFGSVRRACDAFINEATVGVSGQVRFTLSAGSIELAGLRADEPAYLTDRDAWEVAIAGQRGARSLSEQVSGRSVGGVAA